MMHEPSSSISAMGKPGRPRSTSVKNEKLPPVDWAPHSRTCPATTAPASASQSSRLQSKCAAAAPTTSDASVTRPVMTTLAPRFRHSAIPHPPRYALAVSGVPRPSSLARAMRSSPSTCATFATTPSSVATARTAAASPAGLSPPAFTTMRTFFATASASDCFIWRRKVFA